jgi:hypothetical protein
MGPLPWLHTRGLPLAAFEQSTFQAQRPRGERSEILSDEGGKLVASAAEGDQGGYPHQRPPSASCRYLHYLPPRSHRDRVRLPRTDSWHDALARNSLDRPAMSRRKVWQILAQADCPDRPTCSRWSVTDAASSWHSWSRKRRKHFQERIRLTDLNPFSLCPILLVLYSPPSVESRRGFEVDAKTRGTIPLPPT